jgi:hypothetical protein
LLPVLVENRFVREGFGGNAEATMEARIQYAQTADGVSVAFWTLGEGCLAGSVDPWDRRPQRQLEYLFFELEQL